MRLGLNIGFVYGGDDHLDHLRLVKEAETLGFSVTWAAEAYGSDAATLLSWIAAQTTTIDVGAAVFQIPARTPAMTAMTAATLDRLSNGRFRLGLGVSGPQVSEGWHGVRFAQPLQRTREYVDIVNSALRRETVAYEGKYFTLPLPDGPGKALKLTVRPIRDHVPVYLAAVGPKNLELAGEIADGWLGILNDPGFLGEQLAHIRTGRGRELDGFDVVASVPLMPGADPQAAADPIRGYAALYIGGMGSREKNFYNALAVRMGYADEAKEIQDLYLAKKHREAMAAVPFGFLDSISLLGDKARLADKLTAYAEAGATTVAVTPFAPTVEQRIADLRTLAEALDLAGIGN
ncbi:LLM class F420-dependent oxidoreductase [Kribbella solani]|uniref:F420-dependent oxidoreductase-like protein n=1 Tax=Kribbella solani TaxID=236067 RepID=A0A841DFU4_9ACTN|nr:LLM class F420-dependent oxidoreductase [Kribbella solani]MBB5977964.1 F420-dependent oxidoreductase-like protein [Kribbella solani]MDX2973275.1 LLM class F420-dependent oxidoreductase [Kribbella solani]MDX3006234.1 LLM class F420-dependent oxidoreductase [Kribbella solani]